MFLRHPQRRLSSCGRILKSERSRLGANINWRNPSADDFALIRMRDAIDKWVDDVVDQGLIYGSPEVLDDLRKGRMLRVGARNVEKNKNSISRRIANSELDNEQIASARRLATFLVCPGSELIEIQR